MPAEAHAPMLAVHSSVPYIINKVYPLTYYSLLITLFRLQNYKIKIILYLF